MQRAVWYTSRYVMTRSPRCGSARFPVQPPRSPGKRVSFCPARKTVSRALYSFHYASIRRLLSTPYVIL